MTVSTSYAPIVSPGNGTAAAISVTWPFFDADDLLVTAIAADGVETVKALTTDYTVTGGTDADGLPATGTVTPVATRASGTSWRLERVTPKRQATAWDAFEKFSEKSVEAALDRLTLIGQETATSGGGSGGLTLDTSGAVDVWDAGSYPVRSSATPSDDDDLITKAYGDATYGVASATAAAASAATAATNASTATTAASTATTAAATATTAAATATTQASNASTSATAAATSATAALAAAGFTFTYSTTTTMADPSSGGVRLNNATLASVTAIAISDLAADAGNPDVSPWVLTWDDSTNTTKGLLRFRKKTNAAVYVDYAVTGLTDNSGWTQLAVSYVGGAGSLSNSDVMVVSFYPVGNKGTDGAGVGDVVGPAASVDNEIALYNSTTGKLLKRATTTGLLKASSGVLSAATAGTDYMHPGTTSTLTKGFTVAPNNIGTVSSGTTTPDPANGNYQYYTNNGAHTLAAPSSDCAIDILITNGASAGAITFSGFTVGSSTGEALTTTNTHKFIVSIRRVNAVSTYLIKALQ